MHLAIRTSRREVRVDMKRPSGILSIKSSSSRTGNEISLFAKSTFMKGACGGHVRSRIAKLGRANSSDGTHLTALRGRCE